MENNFVHLNLHTEYSLLEGVNSIDSFLTRAKELGMNSFGCDRLCQYVLCY